MNDLTDFQTKINDLCWVLDEYKKSRSFPSSRNDLCADARVYQKCLLTVDKDPQADVLTLLQTAEFRPFLLMNGLIFFSSLKPAFRQQILEVLSAALKEFSNYYANKETPLEIKNTEQDEKRLFAFLLAYLPKAGMDLLGIIMTMKGDSSLQTTSSALRDILEGNEKQLMSSSLFTPKEKNLLQAIMERNTEESWQNFSSHFIQTYQLPNLKIIPLGS